ncbi:hypothetical protein [Mycobacterium interjectum]|uniref:hypothetical protein n=1 Tax=Mycobacterium interjectum TaxID=33895 RepID=UPI000B1D8B62|nr:hypothetical protein [Mycobacterium interjectum]MCV7089615.1 hypothetical protein [Mycobacterium interjectum]
MRHADRGSLSHQPFAERLAESFIERQASPIGPDAEGQHGRYVNDERHFGLALALQVNGEALLTLSERGPMRALLARRAAKGALAARQRGTTRAGHDANGNA